METLYTRKFWNAAFARALRTLCQVAGSMLVIGAFNETAWGILLQTAILAAASSLLTSIAKGLPEVD